MPPKQRFQREDILKVAYEIAKNQGIEDLNARKIAAQMHCSTQPIYHNFDTMEELKAAVVEKIYSTYVSYMRQGATEEKPYLGMGMSYIRFARDYPNFFRILFMRESKLSPVDFLVNDDVGHGAIREGQVFSGLTEEQQKVFHLKVWVLTYGFAALVASKTVQFSDEEIRKLLASTTRELLVGFKGTQNQEET